METGSRGGAPGSATGVQGAHAGTAAAALFLSFARQETRSA